MKPVEFSPPARAELEAAADYNERTYAGRGFRLYGAVERAVAFIAQFPDAAPLYPNLPSELGVRRCVVRGFPFVIIYRDLGTVIRIDAVAHTRRRPGYWLRRVRSRP